MSKRFSRRQLLGLVGAIGVSASMWSGIGYAQTGSVTAIDILLEPDAVMLEKAQATNARLRHIYPAGFALDESHRAHITVIQRFVRTDDLDKVYAAANQVLAQSNVKDIKIEALKYFYMPTGDTGLSGIVAKPTPELIKLQAELLNAVAPFTVKTGDSSAFVTTPEDPVIDPVLINYVSTFEVNSSGDKYTPHVTTGVALKADLDAMLAEPFQTFSFSPAGAAVYQLGQFGTASKKLKQLSVGK